MLLCFCAFVLLLLEGVRGRFSADSSLRARAAAPGRILIAKPSARSRPGAKIWYQFELLQDRRRGVECSTRYSTLGVVSTVKNRGSQVALGPQKCGLTHRSGGVTAPHTFPRPVSGLLQGCAQTLPCMCALRSPPPVGSTLPLRGKAVIRARAGFCGCLPRMVRE